MLFRSLNLLVNANQAITSGRGEIRLTLSPAPGQWWLQITDNGNGIAEQFVPHIFEPFFTTKPKGQGTGLGLSLSQSIVDKHGGWIGLDSEVGQGSCFTVWLPVRQSQRNRNVT